MPDGNVARPTLRHTGLVAILLAAGVLRLGWAFSRPTDLSALPDQQEYLAIARNVLAGQGFTFVDPRFGQQVYAFRMPGYPLFLAACGGDVLSARVVQTLLDTSSVLAVYLLARRWLDRGPALFAAGLVGVNPFLIYFSATLLTETLFTVLLTWGLLLLVTPRRWAWGAILLVLSIYVRPSALALPLVLGTVAVFANRDSAISNAPRVGHVRIPVMTLLLLMTGLALLPWAYRNANVLGQWVWTTTNSGITRYDGFNPDADGSSNQSFVVQMPQLKGMSELGRDRYLSDRAGEYVRSHPGRAVELALAKVGRTWSPVPLSDGYSDWKYRLAGLLYSLPLDVLVVFGLWKGLLPARVKWLLVLPALYFTAVHALSVGSLRYRVPVEAPLAVLAAAGVAGGVALGSRRGRIAEGAGSS